MHCKNVVLGGAKLEAQSNQDMDELRRIEKIVYFWFFLDGKSAECSFFVVYLKEKDNIHNLNHVNIGIRTYYR